VHITNSMFLGLAEPLKRELGVPVLCSLQGEDIFLDDLAEPFKSKVHGELQAHARAVDGLVATCGYYADFMADYLAVERDKVHVVPLGIKLDGHSGAPRARAAQDPFVVGYLARICPEKGLHELIEAFALLAEQHGKEKLRLRVAGYLGKRDEQYFGQVRARVTELGLDDVFEYAGEIDRRHKIAFLQSLDVLSVPTTYRDPKGLFVLEALANGVPVVQPSHGSFPEMVETTGGGLLSEPGSAESLADRLGSLMLDEARRQALGAAGAAVVRERFSDAAMADTTLAVYRHWVPEPAPGAAPASDPPTVPSESTAP
jgi:glycosyltransferase involved in cell wall biosynthesis